MPRDFWAWVRFVFVLAVYFVVAIGIGLIAAYV
jgi:hypothetical protein